MGRGGNPGPASRDGSCHVHAGGAGGGGARRELAAFPPRPRAAGRSRAVTGPSREGLSRSAAGGSPQLPPQPGSA